MFMLNVGVRVKPTAIFFLYKENLNVNYSNYKII